MMADRLDEIRTRADAATSGPWGVWTSMDNAAFIAHARSDIPYLLDRLAASEQEAARLGAALRHYGQHDEACHIARCQYDEQQNVLPGSHCGCGLLQALGATTAPEAERAGPDGGAG
jgi:hypothetical protein